MNDNILKIVSTDKGYELRDKDNNIFTNPIDKITIERVNTTLDNGRLDLGYFVVIAQIYFPEIEHKNGI